MTTANRTNRTEKLDLRLTPAAKQALVAAALADHRSVSEFVLDSALSRAQEMLAQRQHFGLDAVKWAEFLGALESGPRELPAVQALFAKPSPFEAPLST
jgi:uncharacterized protein (DUF1778 family)